MLQFQHGYGFDVYDYLIFLRELIIVVGAPALALLLIVWAIKVCRRTPLRWYPSCPSCHYDLRMGVSDACPECGMDLLKSGVRPPEYALSHRWSAAIRWLLIWGALAAAAVWLPIPVVWVGNIGHTVPVGTGPHQLNIWTDGNSCQWPWSAAPKSIALREVSVRVANTTVTLSGRGLDQARSYSTDELTDAFISELDTLLRSALPHLTADEVARAAESFAKVCARLTKIESVGPAGPSRNVSQDDFGQDIHMLGVSAVDTSFLREFLQTLIVFVLLSIGLIGALVLWRRQRGRVEPWTLWRVQPADSSAT